MATDPPYLVDYDGGNHPQTWRPDGARPPPRGEDPPLGQLLDPETAAAFYQNFLSVAIAEALGPRPAIYQWFGMLRAGLGRAAWSANKVSSTRSSSGTRAAPCWGAAGLCGTTSPVPWAGLRAASRQPVGGRRPPPGRSGRSIRRRGRGGPWLRPSHHQAGRADPPADRVAHRPRRADLRALLRQRHGHHRSPADRPPLPRHRTCPGVRRRRHPPLAGLHGRVGDAGR